MDHIQVAQSVFVGLFGAAAGFVQRKWGHINHTQPKEKKKGCQRYPQVQLLCTPFEAV